VTTTESEALDVFRKQVRIRLDQAELSISELAKRANLSRRIVSQLLSGVNGCTLANADSIARALGCRLPELLSEPKQDRRSQK